MIFANSEGALEASALPASLDLAFDIELREDGTELGIGGKRMGENPADSRVIGPL